ncbi:MAG: PAS domain-containing protein [Verrucomicrobiales bacterium]|nr:PAS domain-containing protein [Verrucomicrobiales bacterium]
MNDAYDRLRVSEQRLREAVECLGVGIFDHDHVRNEVYWSPEHRALCGWEMESSIGLPEFLALVHAEDGEAVAGALEGGCDPAGTGLVDVEFRLKRKKDGELRWVRLRARVHFDGIGVHRRAVRTVGTLLDISAHKKAERALAESEERLRLAIMAANQGLYDLDVQTGNATVSPEYATMLGYDPTTFRETNESWIGRLHPDDHDRVASVFREYMAGRLPDYQVEFRQRTAQGGWKWILSLGRIVEYDGQGRPRRMLGTHTDITERKEAEEALAKSMRRLQAVVTGVPVVLYSFDRHGVFTLSEGQGLSGIGLRPGEVVGRSIFEVYGDRSPGVTNLQRALGGETFTAEMTFPSGSIFEVSHVALRDGAGNYDGTIGLLVDITERKKAERALRESENHLRRSQSVAHLGSYDFSIATGTWISSSALDEVFGIDGTFSRTIGGWESLIHPEDRESMMDHLLNHVMRGGHRFEREYRIRRHNDGQERWVRGLGELDLDGAGRPVRMIGTIQDITESKRAELALQTSLEEKDALLRELHHRVKNNLQIVSSLLSLKAHRERDENVLTALRDTQGRVHAMALLHEALYRSQNLARVDFGPYVRHLCAHLARAYGQSARPVVVEVKIDGLQLDLDRAVPCGLIVSEAVTNAFKHAFGSRGAGGIEVAARSLEGKLVELRISDDGIGLPPAFDPSRADTLGFQLLSRLAQQLEGRMRVETGEGTCVVVTFPMALPERPAAAGPGR